MNRNLLLLALIIITINVSCKKDNPSSSSNTEPIAIFTINPTSGSTTTIFTFDANGCQDKEDDTSILRVRWDWENDGTYDTPYRTNKIETHEYSSPSPWIYTVKLKVIDSEGLSSITTQTVSTADNAQVD